MRFRLAVASMLCIFAAAANAAQESIPVEVLAAEAVTGNAETVYRSLGEVISSESIGITSTTPGTIEKLFFSDGAVVSKGDRLIQMDRRMASTLLQNSKAQLDLAEKTLSRTQDLFKKQLRTQVDLQKDTAALASAQAEYDAKKTSLDVLTITAPFDGVLSNREASVGAFINPGQPIVTLQSLNKLELKFKVPQILSDKVAIGQAVRVTSNVDDRTLDTKVSRIGAVLDQDTRLLALQAEITDPLGLLRAGTFVRIELVLAERNNAVLVPEAAVIHNLSGDYVFVANGERAERKIVTLGETRDGFTEILSGLTAGTKVITQGQFKLEDGGTIAVK
jgi:membrane fusion protein (multidrug efflux system)